MLESRPSYFSLMEVNVGPLWTLILLLLVNASYVTPQTDCSSCTYNFVALPNQPEQRLVCNVNAQREDVVWLRENNQSLYQVVNDFRTKLCPNSEHLCINNVMPSDEGHYRCDINAMTASFENICFRVYAVPEFEENLIHVDLVSEGTSVRLDTRIVYRNGGECGDIQETDNMELRRGGCSGGTIQYDCEAQSNGRCGNDPDRPNVGVEYVDSSAGPSEYYNFRLRVDDVPVDMNTTYCAVLHIKTPDGFSRTVMKTFNVMYRAAVPSSAIAGQAPPSSSLPSPSSTPSPTSSTSAPGGGNPGQAPPYSPLPSASSTPSPSSFSLTPKEGNSNLTNLYLPGVLVAVALPCLILFLAVIIISCLAYVKRNKRNKLNNSSDTLEHKKKTIDSVCMLRGSGEKKMKDLERGMSTLSNIVEDEVADSLFSDSGQKRESAPSNI